jgi:hypothetical protein
MSIDVKFSVGLVVGALLVFLWYKMREQKG